MALESFDVTGRRSPQATLTLHIHRTTGARTEVSVLCRLDTEEEVSITMLVACLQRFAQDFLADNAPADSLTAELVS